MSGRSRSRFNAKRRIASVPAGALDHLVPHVQYRGNPEHKRNPGDFGLQPPAAPRRGKTLCDNAGVDRRETAETLLLAGLRRGLVSERRNGEFPQNLWAVDDAGQAFEAQLENREQGAYHGYPTPSKDPLREEVLRRWRETPDV